MKPLEYSIKRLRAVRAQIKELKESEFPYKDSSEALDILDKLFLTKLERLESFDKKSNSEAINTECSESLMAVFNYLPILGFILRSTNVRNAFEIFGPLRRLAEQILEHGVDNNNKITRLVLSSEWSYSPHIYTGKLNLSGFLFVGLPAPESANPFLIPLAGHEFGHAVWINRKISKGIEEELYKNIFIIINSKWHEYKNVFAVMGKKPSNLEKDLSIRRNVRHAIELTFRHSEESFCDFIGLRIFGQSYLYAFAYLLSPKIPGARSVRYPNTNRRVKNLILAAKHYKIACPPNYKSSFADSGEPKLTPAEKFNLSVADKASDNSAFVLKLIEEANNFIDYTRINKSSKSKVMKIYNRFNKVVPADKCDSLPDILNAAWMAHQNPSLWKQYKNLEEGRKYIVLKELVLKSIEVFDIEQIKIKAENGNA